MISHAGTRGRTRLIALVVLTVATTMPRRALAEEQAEPRVGVVDFEQALVRAGKSVAAAAGLGALSHDHATELLDRAERHAVGIVASLAAEDRLAMVVDARAVLHAGPDLVDLTGRLADRLATTAPGSTPLPTPPLPELSITTVMTRDESGAIVRPRPEGALVAMVDMSRLLGETRQGRQARALAQAMDRAEQEKIDDARAAFEAAWNAVSPPSDRGSSDGVRDDERLRLAEASIHEAEAAARRRVSEISTASLAPMDAFATLELGRLAATKGYTAVLSKGGGGVLTAARAGPLGDLSDDLIAALEAMPVSVAGEEVPGAQTPAIVASGARGVVKGDRGRYQLHPGPRRDSSKIAVLECPAERSITIVEVDGKTGPGGTIKRHDGSCDIEILPGRHWLHARKRTSDDAFVTTSDVNRLSFEAEAGRRYTLEGEVVSMWDWTVRVVPVAAR